MTTVDNFLTLVLMLLQLLTSKNRGPFVQFLQLLVVHHPSKRLSLSHHPLNVSVLLVHLSIPEQQTKCVLTM